MNKKKYCISILLIVFVMMLAACGKNRNDKREDYYKDKESRDIITTYLNGYVYREDGKYVAVYNSGENPPLVYNGSRECEQSNGLVLADRTDYSTYQDRPFSDVIRDLGEPHTDIGSGLYIPAYFTKDAHLAAFHVDQEKVAGIDLIDLLGVNTIKNIGKK